MLFKPIQMHFESLLIVGITMKLWNGLPILSTGGSATTSTYNLFEDQVTLAGEVYTDTHFANFTNGNKRVIAMAVIPIENFAPSSVFDDYHYPNFIPTNFWSYGEVGVDYCLAMGLCWFELS